MEFSSQLTKVPLPKEHPEKTQAHISTVRKAKRQDLAGEQNCEQQIWLSIQSIMQLYTANQTAPNLSVSGTPTTMICQDEKLVKLPLDLLSI